MRRVVFPAEVDQGVFRHGVEVSFNFEQLFIGGSHEARSCRSRIRVRILNRSG